MRSILLKSLFICLVAVASLSCGGRRVLYIADEKFPPTPPGQEIKLFVNATNRPHIKLAYVESFTAKDRSQVTVQEQLIDMTDRARKLGADAVVEVRYLKNKIRGFVTDERVPFQAYTQGRYERFFIRGVAVKYVEEADPDAEGESLEETPIPSIDTPDPEEDYPMEPAPRGLAPPLP